MIPIIKITTENLWMALLGCLIKSKMMNSCELMMALNTDAPPPVKKKTRWMIEMRPYMIKGDRLMYRIKINKMLIIAQLEILIPPINELGPMFETHSPNVLVNLDTDHQK